jgi:hypothetical protein
MFHMRETSGNKLQAELYYEQKSSLSSVHEDVLLIPIGLHFLISNHAFRQRYGFPGEL